MLLGVPSPTQKKASIGGMWNDEEGRGGRERWMRGGEGGREGRKEWRVRDGVGREWEGSGDKEVEERERERGREE